MQFAPMLHMQNAPASHLCSKLCRKESCCQPSCTATHHQQRRMLCISTDSHSRPVNENREHDCLQAVELHAIVNMGHCCKARCAACM